jgi:hypothetical protein
VSGLVEPTLEAMSIVPAPKDLLSRDLIERALKAGKPGGRAALPALGAGAAKTSIVITAALGLFVAAGVGVQAARRRASTLEPFQASAGKGRTSLREARGGETAAAEAAAGVLPGRIPHFKSTAFFQAEFERAAHLVSDPERAKALRLLGFELTEDEFLAVARDSHGKKGGHRFAREFAATLLSRWARKNPPAAASLFRDLPRDEEEPHPYVQIISGKTGIEFPQVYRYTRLRDVIVEWSKRDRDAAGAFVATVPTEDRENLLRTIQAQSDPETLAKMVLSLEGKERALAIKALAESWGEKNPEVALRWGEQLPLPSDPTTREGYLETELRSDFLALAVGSWARSAPEKALAWAMAAPDRRGLILPIVEELAKTDPKAAVDIVDRKLPPNPQDDFDLHPTALIQIASRHPNPQAAADMLLARRQGDPSSPWSANLISFVTGWAQDDDPDQAMRWATARSDPSLRAWLIVGAAIGRATSVDWDIVGAMAALKTLPEDIRRSGASQILSAYAQQRPSEAAALAQSFQEPVPIMEIAQELARQDLEGALTWARSVPDAPTRDKAFCDLSSGPLGLCWQGQDIPRAIALAAEIRDPSIRLHTQARIATYWASRSDPEPVLDWVLGLSSETFPPARGQTDWIYHTHNSRKEIFDLVVGGWANEDAKRQAAERWIEQSALPEESKRALLGKLKNQN